MPVDAGARIEVHELTKRFRSVTAVQQLSFRAEPGRVTAFLGPNGSGKTTTLRCILGLVRPTSGSATVGSATVHQIARSSQAQPATIIGAALEASGFHPGRTARDHLRSLAAAGGIASARCDAVLERVGLADAARRRVGGFSLGMRQRLTLAAALLGDPQAIILDEPANGLDPEGIAWLRHFLRALADDGRTVLVSSHALSEMQQTADDVVIITAGRLRFAGPIADLAGAAGAPATTTRVCTPQAAVLRAALEHAHPQAVIDGEGEELIVALPAPVIGALALRCQVELHELRPIDRQSTPGVHVDTSHLESAFLRLTSEPPVPTDPNGGARIQSGRQSGPGA